MRTPMLIATAQTIELQKNIETAVSNTIFQPNISERLDQIGPPAAIANRYADPIHTYPWEDFRSEAIVGTAVATIL